MGTCCAASSDPAAVEQVAIVPQESAQQPEAAKAEVEVKTAEAVKEPEAEAPKEEAPKPAEPEAPKVEAPAAPENPCPTCGKSLETTTCWTVGECDICKAVMKKGEPVDRCKACEAEWWRCEKCSAAKKSS